MIDDNSAVPPSRSPAILIDSHCHLDGPKFEQDREAALLRAAHAGIGALLAIGNGDGPEQADCALKIAAQYSGRAELPKIYASVGVHPHEARLATPQNLAQLGRWARDERVVAWGEIGLDYFYDHSPREVQRDAFARQMELAAEAGLPIIIHCRPSQADPNDAWEDCLELIKRRSAPRNLGGVLHCFTGEWSHAERAMGFGYYLSFAGNVTYPKAENIRAAARQAPADRILVETDSPYLAPAPHRGKRNEPALVADTARFIAELRGVSVEELARQTTSNFYRLFSRAT
jgi:TatD DNase family protein